MYSSPFLCIIPLLKTKQKAIPWPYFILLKNLICTIIFDGKKIDEFDEKLSILLSLLNIPTMKYLFLSKAYMAFLKYFQPVRSPPDGPLATSMPSLSIVDASKTVEKSQNLKKDEKSNERHIIKLTLAQKLQIIAKQVCRNRAQNFIYHLPVGF